MHTRQPITRAASFITAMVVVVISAAAVTVVAGLAFRSVDGAGVVGVLLLLAAAALRASGSRSGPDPRSRPKSGPNSGPNSGPGSGSDQMPGKSRSGR